LGTGGDGWLEGCDDGKMTCCFLKEGLGVGSWDGLLERYDDGIEEDGFLDGIEEDGSLDGWEDGFLDGWEDGFLEGWEDGSLDG